MKLSKLLLAAMGAMVLFAALASSASARNLSMSGNRVRAIWTRMDFGGGFGTVECEVTLEGTVHSRTIAKVVGQLIGNITRATINNAPCRRGGATILSETLPWNFTYAGFVGTLPNITSINTNVIGSAFKVREPSFGATCLARSTEAEPSRGTYNLGAGGAMTSATVGGEIRCRGGIEVTGTLRGTSGTPDDGTVGRGITVTLI